MGAGDLWLRNARVPGSAAPTDIVVHGGRIDTVGSAPTGWRGPAIDARGYLVLPATPAEAAVVRPPRSLVVKRGLPVAGPLAVG